MTSNYCIINGEIVESSKGGISPLDRGFMYGDGSFDTMYAPNGTPFLFDEHMKRLRGDLSKVGITLPHSDDDIYSMITELILKNGLTGIDSYTRTTVTRGINLGAMYYAPTSPTLVILANKVSDRIIKSRETGVRCIISDVIKSTDNPLYSVKSLNFLWAIMGAKAASQKGADECIFFNSAGFLSEGAKSNTFIIKDGAIYTPGDDCALLPGITRDYLTRILGEKGISVTKRKISETELLAADEVFLTSSIMGVAPVIDINGHVFETQRTKEISEIYFSSIKSV